ncbi:MAG: rod-binding protein [Vampirovibrionales bacterium]|nr:rod-binding protein [Vampirovibrionales bacterium]
MVELNTSAASPLMGINTLQLQQGQMRAQDQSTAQATQRIEKQIKEWADKKDTSKLSSSDADKLVAEHAKLQKAARDLEGVFVQQLLTAMDKTVDRTNSMMGGGGQAEGMFRDMMYENMATQMVQAPGGSGMGLADTIYRQMSAHLPALPSATNALGGVQGSIKLMGESHLQKKSEQSAPELTDAPPQENPAKQAEEESRKQAATLAYQRASLPVTSTTLGGDHEPSY